MENALGWVQQDSVSSEFGEECTEVLVMLFRGAAKVKDVVQIGETEVQAF
jgi:hypothetical protein